MADAQLAFDLLLAQTEAIENVFDAAPFRRGSTRRAAPHRTTSHAIVRPRRRRAVAIYPKCNLPEVRIEVPDPELEGKAERIGVEVVSRVAFERGGYRRLVLARVVYKESMNKDESGQTEGRSTTARPEPTFRIVTAPMPEGDRAARDTRAVHDRARADDEVR